MPGDPRSHKSKKDKPCPECGGFLAHGLGCGQGSA